MSHPIPQWLRDAISTIENCAPNQNGMQVFTQMRTVVQSYFESTPAHPSPEEIRNSALEEAANACTNTQLMNIDSYSGGTASMCADRIRALKSQLAQLSGNSGGLPSDHAVDEFLSQVRAELIRAREKFPGDRIMTIALAEEFGELCKAVLDESSDNVRKEAVQTAVMCARIVLDGDGSVNAWRNERGLDPLVKSAQQSDCKAEPSDTALIDWMEAEAPTIKPENVPMGDTGDYEGTVLVYDSCMNPRDQKRLGTGDTYRSAIKAAMRAEKEGA